MGIDHLRAVMPSIAFQLEKDFSQVVAHTAQQGNTMTTIMVTHEVNDVKHWLASTKREEIFGPMGITLKTFVDPAGSKLVGLVGNIPDMAAFQKFMETQTAADAMKQDGVRPETLKMLVAS
jgi:hypothetical protein